MINERELMEKLLHKSEPFCLKKKPVGDEKPGPLHYTAFGVICSRQLPLEVYLRGDGPADDFKRSVKYDSIDALMADGWVVD